MLSDTYYELKQTPNPFPKPQDKYVYDLRGNQAWDAFMKFPNFRRIQRDFYKALQSSNIPPEVAKQFNSFDFEDLLVNYYRQQKIDNFNKNRERDDMPPLSAEEEKVIREQSTFHFVKESSKERAVKLHTTNHEAELRRYFLT